MKRRVIAVVVSLVMATLTRAEGVDAVNCFIGTEGDGHCWPGATVPFGLVQASPDTGYQDWNYVAGYRQRDRRILGFSQTHNSGGGGPIFGDIGLMPFGDDGTKAGEEAHPGYYRVTFRSGVNVEITATAHGACYKMGFPEERSRADISVNLNCGIGNGTWARKRIDVLELDDKTPGGIDGLNLRNGFIPGRRVGYSIRFDPEPVAKRAEGREYVFTFDLRERKTVEVRLALSTTSRVAAVANRRAELDGRSFESLRSAAEGLWRNLIGRVELDPSTDRDVAAIFYTGIYRLFVVPTNISDASEKPYYSNLSFWDTFRGVHPFYTILAPEQVPELVNSMLNQGERTGYLPIMPNWGRETQCMIATHSVPVIVDAFLKGFGGVDWRRAYEMVRETLTRSHADRLKEDWDVLDRYGYYPCDKVAGEGVSRTLECSYDDWCAQKMAEKLGTPDEAAFFAHRAGNWRNVFDSKTRFMRGRLANGDWREPFDPYRYGRGASGATDFTEANAFQYRWHVLQDVEGLFGALGGKAASVALIDELFDKVRPFSDERNASGLWGGYAHGNEPVHHIPYLLTLCDRPDLAADRINGICERFYRNAPDGFCGNEDHGEMSVWYVFACLGFYPVNPCGGEFVLGAPQVPGAVLHLPRGDFRITARNFSKTKRHVRSVLLNGKPKARTICWQDIVCGGELTFEMCE